MVSKPRSFWGNTPTEQNGLGTPCLFCMLPVLNTPLTRVLVSRQQRNLILLKLFALVIKFCPVEKYPNFHNSLVIQNDIRNPNPFTWHVDG